MEHTFILHVVSTLTSMANAFNNFRHNISHSLEKIPGSIKYPISRLLSTIQEIFIRIAHNLIYIMCWIPSQSCTKLELSLQWFQVVCRLTPEGRLIVTAPKSPSCPVREVPILKAGASFLSDWSSIGVFPCHGLSDFWCCWGQLSQKAK